VTRLERQVRDRSAGGLIGVVPATNLRYIYPDPTNVPYGPGSRDSLSTINLAHTDRLSSAQSRCGQ